MQKAKPFTSIPHLRETRKRSDWLDGTEFVAVVGSGIGLVVSVLAEQAIVAAFPLTLAISLNFLNRRRFQQQFQNEHRAAIATVYDIIKSLPDADNITALTDKILRLEQSNQAMTAQIEALKQQVRVKLKPERLEVLKESISLLRADLTEIQNQALQRQELESHLQTQLEQLYARFEGLSPIQQPEEVRRLENAIATLHRDLGALKGHVAPIGGDWQGVPERVAQLQAHLQAVERAIVPMRRKQEAMTNRLLPRMVKLINELRHPSHPTPVQKTIVHRPPPPPSLLHQSVNRPLRSQPGTSGTPQPLHQQPQRERF